MKKIDGYPNYFITEDGKIWNDRKKIFLKPMLNRGYYQIILCKHSKHKTFKPHRLVGISYVPNPLNRKEINHKDGNKLNNHYTNLEWCTRSENNLHKYRTGLFKPTEKMLNAITKRHFENRGLALKTKPVLNLATGIYYNSVADAARSIVGNATCLARKLKGQKRNNTDFIFA